MVCLKQVTQENYNECLELQREKLDYVVIGLVILDEKGKNESYEFTDLFIADLNKRKSKKGISRERRMLFFSI